MTLGQPRPRTLWGESWRVLAAAVTGAMLLAVVYTDSNPRLSTERQDLLTTLDLVVGAACLVLLVWRRRWPLAVAVVLVLATAVSAMAVAAAGIAVISLATHRRWAPLAVVGVLWVANGFVFELVRPSGAAGSHLVLTNLVITLLSLAVCIAIGYYIGARRDLYASWKERAETAEREQASRVAQARATERSRIAREMHDVLAHRISLVAMHSGALAYRTDLDAEETAQAAAVVRDNAHLALSELRDVLGVLRSTDEPLGAGAASPERPQPTLAGLDQLVAETRESGTPVEVDADLDALSGAPESLSRSGYRIVQEGLTNVRKHAPGATATVAVTGSQPEGVSIEVRNPIPVGTTVAGLPTSGMGLTGLMERALLAGGTLTFGPDRRGDFVLRAWLPWVM